MGIVSIQKFGNNSCLGLWNICEPLEELLQGVDLNQHDLFTLEKKISVRKKKEWLACKNLVRSMTSDVVAIDYDLNGRPFDMTGKYHVSMSHSGHYASAYLSESGPVGTDVQRLKPTISAGADFFLNKDELKWVDIEDNRLMHLVWSAKESAFKFAAQNDLNFKKDIVLNCFNSNQNEHIEVTIFRHQATEKIRTAYSFFEEYVLTWTI